MYAYFQLNMNIHRNNRYCQHWVFRGEFSKSMNNSIIVDINHFNVKINQCQIRLCTLYVYINIYFR